jgi:hypothetical protein
MGKIDINSLGISGKIGPIIAYVTKTGKQVFKKYVVPKDPRTEKQLASRMRFGLANSAASPLNKALKRSFSNQANAYRKTVSQILKNAIQGEYPDYSVDYSSASGGDVVAWAYFYFEKVKRYGDVPWIGKALDVEDPDLYKPRDPRTLVMDSVLADLNFACENIILLRLQQLLLILQYR